MHSATSGMSDVLKKSITTGKPTRWRTHKSSFHDAVDPALTPGCINISPCWFQQGREVSATLADSIPPIPDVSRGWAIPLRTQMMDLIPRSRRPSKVYAARP